MKCKICGNERDGFTGTLNLDAIGYGRITNLCENCYIGFTAQITGDLKDDEGYIQVDGEEEPLPFIKFD